MTSTTTANWTSPALPLAPLLAEKKVLVCVGSGGVGKTTTAAALALLASTLGRRALVITIDPAKRLANSLGLDGLSHTPKTLPRELLEQAGLQPTADVDAMMLDLQAAWDDLLARVSPDDDMREKLMQNRFYLHLTRDLPGAQEFVACEALQTLLDKGIYDVVILDTPPTSNALDFLEAPSRILDFLENEALRKFYGSTFKKGGKRDGESGFASKMGLKFLDGAAGVVQAGIAKITGQKVLEDLGDFLGLIRDFVEPLKERTRAFQTLLRSNDARFVVVTAPEAATLNEALHFTKELQDRQLPLAGVVVNRVMPAVEASWLGLEPEQLQARIEALPSPPAAPRPLSPQELSYSFQGAVLEQQALADRDQHAIAGFVQKLSTGTAVTTVERQQGDVADVQRLAQLLPQLAGRD